MTLFFTSRQALLQKLEVKKLSENIIWIKQAAIWGEEQWGFLRNFPGMKFRILDIAEIREHFHIVIYGGHAVGMFGLIDHKMIDWKNCSELKIENKLKTISAKELAYVYVAENLRGMGIGNFIMKEAKKIATNEKASFIRIETLNPLLNRFYQKHQAQEVGESQFRHTPTEVLTISLT